MAMVGRTQVGIKKTGKDIEVPNNPKANLMYYLDSICFALNMDNTDADLRKLRCYRNYQALNQDETDKLLILCLLISPDELLNKIIFVDDDMCGDSLNEFYELSAVSHRFLVTESIVIGGKRQQVSKIMACRELWLDVYFLEPIKSFKSRLEAITASGRRRQEPDCTIL